MSLQGWMGSFGNRQVTGTGGGWGEGVRAMMKVSRFLNVGKCGTAIMYVLVMLV